MKAKILYISNFGSVRGGGELSLITLLKELDRSKYQPCLILPEAGDIEAEAAVMDVPCEVMHVPGLKNPLEWPAFYAAAGKLARHISEKGVNLVHANTNTRKSVFAGLAARKAGVPSVCHVRVMDSDGILDGALYRLHDKIIANSDATGARFARYEGKEKKVVTIHNAVDLETFKPGPANEKIRESLGAGQGDVLVCIVGWLHEFKGHRYFIEAAAKTKHIPSLKFAVVGDGPLMDACVRQAKELGVDDRIVFAGHRTDIAEIMQSMDILTLASTAEHFGRVVIEAMACGKPVVGTRAGGVPEIIDDMINGIMVPPRNSGAMAEAIIKLAENRELREKMGAAGAEDAVGRFSAPAHASAIQQIYDSLLGN